MDYISFLSLYLWREPMNLISMAKQKDGFLGEQALAVIFLRCSISKHRTD